MLATTAVLAAGAVLLAGSAANAQGLADVQTLPQRGQSADRTRRDRYECHNWAIEQTGSVPERYDAQADAEDRRSRRINKVLLGAGIGALVGSIVRGNDEGRRRYSGDEAADGALGGAVLGAAVGALAGRGDARDPNREIVESDYVRALTACMEGRGYSVVVRGDDRR